MGHTTSYKAKRAANRHAQQHGFTLVELMVALALGLVLTAGIVTLYTATLKSNSALLKSAQLENELQATMNLMVRDIRRAGYDGAASPMPNYDNPFTLGTPSCSDNGNGKSCTLLFSYDTNDDGNLDADDCLGYRLHNKAVQMRVDAALNSDQTQCAGGDWKDITSTDLINATTLQIEVTTTDAGEMAIRHVKITLSGQLKHDADVNRTLTRYVTVRNNARTS